MIVTFPLDTNHHLLTPYPNWTNLHRNIIDLAETDSENIEAQKCRQRDRGRRGRREKRGGGEGREKTVIFNKFEIAAIVTYSRH